MITACKRNLGQSNVFTHVCHSVHRGKVSASGGRGLHPGGVCLQGGSVSRGSASRGSASRGSASRGGLHLGRVCIQGVCLGEVCIQWGRLELGQTPLQDSWDRILWNTALSLPFTVNKWVVRILLQCFLVAIFFIKRRKDASLRTLIDNWYVTRTKGHGSDLFRDQFREIKRYFPPGNVYLCGKYRLHVRYVGKNPYVNCGGVTNNFQI